MKTRDYFKLSPGISGLRIGAAIFRGLRAPNFDELKRGDVLIRTSASRNFEISGFAVVKEVGLGEVLIDLGWPTPFSYNEKTFKLDTFYKHPNLKELVKFAERRLKNSRI